MEVPPWWMMGGSNMTGEPAKKFSGSIAIIAPIRVLVFCI